MERAALMGKREPDTPFPTWKIHHDENCEFDDSKRAVLAAVATVASINRHSPVSTRKLAAAAWELRQAEAPFFGSGIGNASAPRQLEQYIPAHVLSSPRQVFLPRSPSISNLSPRSTRRISDRKVKKVKTLRQHVSTSKISAADEAKTSDLQELRLAGEGSKILDHLQSQAKPNKSSTRLAAALQRELEHAYAQIQELELSHKAVRKEMDKLLRKLADERAIQRTMEMEKIEAAMKSLQVEIKEERKSKHELEITNSRLGRQLGEANMALFRALQDLERERKTRELLEDVCNEIAQNVGHDRSEVELNSATGRVRDSKQRQKIIQMADLWRKERVQMKLIEARLHLHERNAAVDPFRGRLEELVGIRKEVKNVMDSRDHFSSIQVTGRRNSSYEPWEMNGSGSMMDNFHPTHYHEGVFVKKENTVLGYHSDSLEAESLRGKSLRECAGMVKERKVISRHSRVNERAGILERLRRTDNVMGRNREVASFNHDIVWEFETDLDVKRAEGTLNGSTSQVTSVKNLEKQNSGKFQHFPASNVENLEKLHSINRALHSGDSQRDATNSRGINFQHADDTSEFKLKSVAGEGISLDGALQATLQQNEFETTLGEKQSVISSLALGKACHAVISEPPRNLRKHFARGFKNLVEWRKHNKMRMDKERFLARS